LILRGEVSVSVFMVAFPFLSVEFSRICQPSVFSSKRHDLIDKNHCK
jgi:hypothetical protein